MKNIIKSTFSLTFLCIGCSLFWSGCSKEEIQITDVPFDEIESSFYELAVNTVELPYSDLGDLVINKTDESLILKDDPIFVSLEVGSTIVTDFEVPYEEVILREVTAIDRSNNQITVETIGGSVLKAYTQYYIDSKLPNIIKVREGFDIANIFSLSNAFINTSLGVLNTLKVIPFEAEIGIGLAGTLNFKAEHPNLLYSRLNLCDGGTDCEFDSDSDDSDGDGIYDDVENYFGNDFIDDLIKQGFFNIIIEDLRIDNLSLQIGKSGSPLEAKAAESIYNDANNIPKTTSTGDEKSVLLKYFPTPITVGVFGAFGAAGPITSVTANLGFLAKAELLGGGRVDLDLGNVEINGRVPTIKPTFKITKNGLPSTIDVLYNTSFINLNLGISGSIDKKIGVAIGAVLSAGEPNLAGVSFGAALELGFWSKISGEGGIKIIDILNLQNQRSYDVHGEMCVDFGFFYDLALFTDVNIATAPDFSLLDVKLKFPKASLGLKNPSFLTALIPPSSNGFEPGKGICIKTSECDNIKSDILEVGSIDDPNLLTSRFKFSSTSHPTGTYTIKFKHETGDKELTEIYSFGTEYTTSFTDVDQNFAIAISKNKLEVEITHIALGCNKSFKQDEFGVLLNCEEDFDIDFETNVFGLSGVIAQTDIIGKEYNYFLRDAAKEHCDNLVTSLMSTEDVKTLFSSDICKSTTGYLIPKSGGFIKVDEDKVAVWLPDASGSDNNIMLIDLEVKDGIVKVKSFDETKKPSDSVHALCLCAN